MAGGRTINRSRWRGWIVVNAYGPPRSKVQVQQLTIDALLNGAANTEDRVMMVADWNEDTNWQAASMLTFILSARSK